MKTTLLIPLVAVGIISNVEIVYAQPSPERHSQQAQQENRTTACEQENTFLGLRRIGCMFLRTFSTTPSSGGVTSLNESPSNFSPPSGSGGRSTSVPPIDDRPSERESKACHGGER